ncbi:MAG: D-alanyl-D-alanine carboxypeptidase family protein [Proteobacteria bacterium]|nr:D-alanyl-D-alanine carboxypeptidase family protein [Pseudomonadota bacterium]
MQNRPRHLVNSNHAELWPAWLLRARRNADARALATADWVVRDRDGAYLATIDSKGKIHSLPPLHPSRDADGWRALARDAGTPHAPVVALPTHGLERRLLELGLDAGEYARRSGLMQVPEPSRLSLAGFDRYRRPLWLGDGAGRAWNRMRAAAVDDGVVLDAISGYRSHAYQMGIFARKRTRGLSVDDILAVNAAPGFSEHHSGDALDIGSDGEPPAEESFEHTAAFRWLSDHADDFGFRLSYPRDNPHGIVYEPWHWRWHD